MAYNSNNFEDCTIVYFSLESTGGSTDSDILQIAACEENENFTFSEYVEPRQSIHHKVSSVNGFVYSYGQLYHKGEAVSTIYIRSALENFLEYLQGLQQPVVLAGHNAHNFHGPLLVNAINKFGMNEEFEDVVYGFLDTLTLLREHRANSNFQGKYNIWDLCRYHRVGFHPNSKTAEDKVHALDGIMRSMRRRASNYNYDFLSSIEEFVENFSIY